MCHLQGHRMCTTKECSSKTSGHVVDWSVRFFLRRVSAQQRGTQQTCWHIGDTTETWWTSIFCGSEENWGFP